MSYSDWFASHALKHKKIVEKLLQKGYNKEEIIDYFDFENMCKKEEDFCPLYRDNQKCHDIDSLNCYLCACPNFRFNDEGIDLSEDIIRYSYCDIDSKEGNAAVFNNTIHQDCSACSVPHHRGYVEKHFNTNWKTIMQSCKL